MNLVETHDLLTLASKYDNRRFDDATVMAWQEVLADLPFDDCRTAVVSHVATSDAYLMPVHIVQGAAEIDRIRRRRLREIREAQERLELEAAPRTDRSREIAAGIRDMLPAGNPDALRRAEWLESDRRRERLAAAEPNPDYDPTVAIATAAASEDGPAFNSAYQVGWCGQRSVHAPHVVDHGPDQPRNCPGFDAATRAATLAATKGS